MMNHDPGIAEDIQRLSSLVDAGLLTRDQLEEAATGAAYRGVGIEKILRHEYQVPRRKILEAWSAHDRRPWVEHDERLPVPAELLSPFKAGKSPPDDWFPVAMDDTGILIATATQADTHLPASVEDRFPGKPYDLHVALPEDIQHFVGDFLNNPPRHLVGIERTNLAMWRNTLARWRTKLACYRTDFAKVRTYLSLLRGGLGLIAIARSLMHLYRHSSFYFTYWLMIAAALPLILLGMYHYVRIRKNILSPPRHQTIVEVTAAVLYFLENFQFAEKRPQTVSSRKTELARLAETLANHTVVIDRSYDNKDRSYFAHIRNLLAAQRTLAACYRTAFARARTGLSFMRTGVSFGAIGIGLMKYFGFSLLSGFDLFLLAVSTWMLIDGLLWYLPAYREQAEVPSYIMKSCEE